MNFAVDVNVFVLFLVLWLVKQDSEGGVRKNRIRKEEQEHRRPPNSRCGQRLSLLSGKCWQKHVKKEACTSHHKPCWLGVFTS